MLGIEIMMKALGISPEEMKRVLAAGLTAIESAERAITVSTATLLRIETKIDHLHAKMDALSAESGKTVNLGGYLEAVLVELGKEETDER